MRRIARAFGKTEEEVRQLEKKLLFERAELIVAPEVSEYLGGGEKSQIPAIEPASIIDDNILKLLENKGIRKIFKSLETLPPEDLNEVVNSINKAMKAYEKKN